VHNIQSPTKTQENIQLTTDEEEKKKAEGHAFFNR
jgi:hypothetical protein